MALDDPSDPGAGRPGGESGGFDNPRGRSHWFRRSRQLDTGRLPGGLIAHASRQKRRHEKRLRAEATGPRLTAVAPLAPGSPLNWRPLGPNGIDQGSGGSARPVVSGRVTSLAVGPGGTTVYLGSANGGAWVTRDGGASWRPLDDYATVADAGSGGGGQGPDREADSLSVGALAVRFGAQRSDDTLFVGTGEATGNPDGYFGVGIKVSTDGGRSFAAEATNLTASEIYRIVIDPVDDAIVVAATTTGLYRRPPGPDFSAWIKLPDPDPALAGGAITDLAVVGAGAGRAYHAATLDRVWKSGDLFAAEPASVTWNVVAGVAGPGASGRKSLSAGENDPAVLYCLTEAGSLFRLDGGTAGAFQPVAGVPKALFAGGGGGQGSYDIFVAADPGDADTVYLMGDLTWDGGWALAMFKGRLTGSGGSWRFPFEVANDLVVDAQGNADSSKVPADPTWIGAGVHPDGHCIAFARRADGTHDPAEIWIGCDGGVFQSSSGGTRGTFTSRNTGLGITQMNYLSVDPADPDRMYAGCQDNGTLRYQARDTPPWRQSDAGDGGGVAMDPGNAAQIIRQYVNAGLYLSNDGGATWEPANFPPMDDATEGPLAAFYAPLKAQRAQDKTLVAFGTNRLWFRPDWTAPWVTLPTGTDPYAGAAPDYVQDVLDDRVPVTAIAFGSPTMFLTATSAAGATARVWRFATAGGGWSRTELPPITGLPVPALVFITALAVEDAAKGSFYAALGSAGGEHIVYFDGGAWMSAGLTATTLDIAAHAVALHPGDGDMIFLGSDVGVWQGRKSGGIWKWAPFSYGLPESAILDLAAHASAGVLRAATHGRGVWEIDLPPGRTTSDAQAAPGNSS